MSIDIPLEADNKGVMIYKVPAGTIVYRGAKDPHENYLRGTDIKFFSIDKKAVKQYGRVNEYRIKHPLRLVALDLQNEIFYNNADDDEVDIIDRDGSKSGKKSVQQILRTHYGFTKKTQIRYSVNKYDSAIARYTCQQGYDGYCLNTQMETDFEGSFHTEMAICAPADVVEHADELRSPEPAAAAKSASLYGSPARGSPPRHSRIRTPSPPNRKTRRVLFDMDSPNGGRRRRRRRTKMRKTK
jgi:hypothetical protein